MVLFDIPGRLAGNLLAGLKVLLARPLATIAWHPGVSSYLGVLVLCLALIGYADYSRLTGDIRFEPYGLAGLFGLLFIALLLGVVLSAMQSAYHRLPVLLTVSVSLFFWYLVLFLGITHIVLPHLLISAQWLRWAIPFFALVLGFASIKMSFGAPLMRSYVVAGAGVMLLYFLASSWYFSTRLFYAPSPEFQRYFDVDQEAVYYAQAALIEEKLATVGQGAPNKAELFFVGFAGNSDEKIFRSEVRFAQSVMQEKYLADNRALHLAGSFSALHSEPLPNVYNLKAVLEGVAEKMDVEDDVLMLFLTSHGSRDGSIEVSLSPFEMQQLYASQLRQYLDDAGIVWRIIVVSACFSGSFVEELRDAKTLIATAAAADKTSFGCSSDRELTYFGEALFQDALSQEEDFVRAVTKAGQIVLQREHEEELEPSQPQLVIGEKILEKLQALGLSAR